MAGGLTTRRWANPASCMILSMMTTISWNTCVSKWRMWSQLSSARPEGWKAAAIGAVVSMTSLQRHSRRGERVDDVRLEERDLPLRDPAEVVAEETGGRDEDV